MATGLYALEIRGRAADDFNTCILHFVGENLTTTDIVHNGEDLISTFVNNLSGAWLDLFPDAYQIDRLFARPVQPIKGASANWIPQDGALIGTQGTAFQSNAFCPVIRLIPPMGMATGGKIFLPCAPQVAIVANAIEPTYLANVETFANDALAGQAATTIDWTLGIYSRKTSTYAKAAGWTLSPGFGFQRRRARPY